MRRITVNVPSELVTTLRVNAERAGISPEEAFGKVLTAALIAYAKAKGETIPRFTDRDDEESQ